MAAGRRIDRSCRGEYVEVTFPHTRYALAAYYIVALAEASSNLARYDGVRYGLRASAVSDVAEMYQKTRAQGFGREVRRRIMAALMCFPPDTTMPITCAPRRCAR